MTAMTKTARKSAPFPHRGIHSLEKSMTFSAKSIVKGITKCVPNSHTLDTLARHSETGSGRILESRNGNQGTGTSGRATAVRFSQAGIQMAGRGLTATETARAVSAAGTLLGRVLVR